MTLLEKNILTIYGKTGEQWLKTLPIFLESLCHRWNLTSLKLMPNLSYNYVARGQRDSLPIILKIGIDKKSLKQEAWALKVFQHHGSIRLLEEDPIHGALLLEQAIPGNSLKSFFPNREEESIHITANLIHHLHQATLPSGHPFPTIENWLCILDKEWKVPHAFLSKARALKEKLLEARSSWILLHGDLHHDNILRHGNEWIAIDPKGVIGDPIFEIATFLYNPLPDFLNAINFKERLSHRIHWFANDLKIDETLLKEWGFIKAVLSLCWALEDNLDVTPYLKYLEALA